MKVSLITADLSLTSDFYLPVQEFGFFLISLWSDADTQPFKTGCIDA